MFKLKQIPEDFVVIEDFDILSRIKQNGQYSIFKLIKKNYSMYSAIKHIADYFKIKLKDIGYAGNKDKVALTKQYISIYNLKKPLKNITIKEYENRFIKLEYVGLSNERINLGDHQGNSFEIVVRNLQKQKFDKHKLNELQTLKKIYFINYFGEQRFSKNNIDAGLAIIKKDFRNAVRLIIEAVSDDPDYNEKFNSQKYSEIKLKENSIEDLMIKYLVKNKNDYIGALKLIQKKFLQIHINAVQSALFNSAVSEYIIRKEPTLSEKNTIKVFKKKLFISEKPELYSEQECPIIGFTTEFKNSLVFQIAEEKLRSYNITERDFIIRSLPGLSKEGTSRKISVDAKLDYLNFEEDELNNNRNKIVIKFKLPKGSYATIFVKQIVKKMY